MAKNFGDATVTFGDSNTTYGGSFSTQASPATVEMTTAIGGEVAIDVHYVANFLTMEVTGADVIVLRYLRDPEVTGGCPFCGTYLYDTKRSYSVRSKAINYGRNEDRDALKDNKYVRCGKCGFVCQTQRDLKSNQRSHLGWGLKYPEAEQTRS